MTMTATVAVDAQHDLLAAGLDTREAANLEAALVDALEDFGIALGIDVTVCASTYDADTEPGPLAAALWQLAHDCCVRDGDGSWYYDPDLATGQLETLR